MWGRRKNQTPKRCKRATNAECKKKCKKSQILQNKENDVKQMESDGKNKNKKRQPALKAAKKTQFLPQADELRWLRTNERACETAEHRAARQQQNPPRLRAPRPPTAYAERAMPAGARRRPPPTRRAAGLLAAAPAPLRHSAAARPARSAPGPTRSASRCEAPASGPSCRPARPR